MSGPPPPPPPGGLPPLMPPPPPTFSPTKGGPDERSALLKSIRDGKKLKKTVTNDKSAPVIGKVTSNSSPSPARTGGGGGGAGGGSPMNVGPNNLGGLFANGIPTLKKRPGGVNINGSSSSVNSSSSTSKTPEPAKPNNFNAIQTQIKMKMANDNNVQRGPPPPTPARTYNAVDDSSSRQAFPSRNGSSNGLHQVSSTTSLTSLNQTAGGGGMHRKSNSNVSMRQFDQTDATQNNNLTHKPTINHGKPNLAPKPPSLNGKPAAPKKLIMNGKPIGRTQSMRSPSPQSPDNNNFDYLKSKLNNQLNIGQSLGNLASKRNVRPTDPPPSIPNVAPPLPPSKTVKPPNHAPPPPPNVIPQAPSQAPPPPPHRTVHSRAPPAVPVNTAPPPPPRNSSIRDLNTNRRPSNNVDFESRFSFHTVSEFPRPMPFRNVKKVYTSRPVGSKQQAPLPPNQIQLANRLWESSTC